RGSARTSDRRLPRASFAASVLLEGERPTHTHGADNPRLCNRLHQANGRQERSASQGKRRQEFSEARANRPAIQKVDFDEVFARHRGVSCVLESTTDLLYDGIDYFTG